jgi:hypothetical protein
MTNQAKASPTIYDAMLFIEQASAEDIRALHCTMKVRLAAIGKAVAADIRPGDTVTFEHKKHGLVRGKVDGMKGKNVIVTLIRTWAPTAAPRWCISPTLLTKVNA